MTIFFSTIEQWFWHVWDHFWRLLMWNIVLMTLSWPLLTFPPVPMLIWIALVLGPAFTATISWGWPMADDRSPGAAELWRRLRHVWLRATGLHILFVLVMALLWLNFQFYTGENGQTVIGSMPAMFLAGLTLWIGVYVIILWLWAQVALGEDREQGSHSLLGAIRQAGRITLYHPFLSLMHLLALAGFTYLMIRSRVGMIFFWHGWIAVYLATAVFEMYFDAEAKAEAAREGEAQAEEKPTSWRQIIQDKAPGGHHGRRPRRSLREIFKPWDV
jgi:uncharacterized membrane protein YesL